MAIGPRSVGRFRRETAIAPNRQVGPPAAPPSDRPPDPLPKDPRDAVDIASAYVVGSEQLARPRVVRLIRVLSHAFTEGVASDNLRMLDAEESDHALDTKVTDVKFHRSRLSEQLDIIRARLSRIPPQNRHRFSAAERAGIMTVKHLRRLSNNTTAKWFLVDKGTLSHWNRDVDQAEKRKRPLVEPLADLDAALAALAGKVPKRRNRTRKTKAGSIADVAEPAQKAGNRRTTSPIFPEYKNHYWGSDIIVIRIGRSYFLLAVIDLLSRDILTCRAHAPNALDLHAHRVSGRGRRLNPSLFRTRNRLPTRFPRLLFVGSRTGAVLRRFDLAVSAVSSFVPV